MLGNVVEACLPRGGRAGDWVGALRWVHDLPFEEATSSRRKGVLRLAGTAFPELNSTELCWSSVPCGSASWFGGDCLAGVNEHPPPRGALHGCSARIPPCDDRPYAGGIVANLKAARRRLHVMLQTGKVRKAERERTPHCPHPHRPAAAPKCNTRPPSEPQFATAACVRARVCP